MALADQHNHVTMDIKPPGECPACDAYHRSQEQGHRAEPLIGGESPIGGESRDGGENHFTQQAIDVAVDYAQRVVLIQWLLDLGLDGEADNLRDATESDAAQAAYDIAANIVDICGNAELPELAGKLRDWADQHEKLAP
jgi:hypothetical protein